MMARPGRLGVLLWLLVGSAPFSVSWGQTAALTSEQRRLDVLALDSLLGAWVPEWVVDFQCLDARNRLVSSAMEPGDFDPLEWALDMQEWLACAEDAHLRVAFESLIESRSEYSPPSCERLLGGWVDFGPGHGISLSGQCAWLKRTWPWVGALRPDSLGSDALDVGAAAGKKEGMAVVDHGAFVRWVIPSFGAGSDAAFARHFRRSRRQVRRSKRPVMLDLRGNLGGYRTRRHAVLGVFLDEAEWPEEKEGRWTPRPEWSVVPHMPLVVTRRLCDMPLAVLLDGGSFSASLLLAGALREAGRARVFGCAPLGIQGESSGSPGRHRLPGSGMVVWVPTVLTRHEGAGLAPFDLEGGLDCDAGSMAWREAVQWLLAGDLVPLR